MFPPRRTAASDAAVVLLLLTIVWGSMFPIAGSLLPHLSPDDFLAERALIASIALIAIRPGLWRELDRELIRSGVMLGAVYGLGQILQFEGLARSSVTSTAFIISLFVVFVPVLMALLARTLPDGLTIGGAALAGAGVVLMLFGASFGLGGVLNLMATFGYTVYIVLLGFRAQPGKALALSFVQMATMTVFAFLFACVDGVALPSRTVDWVALVYLAVVAGGGAMVAQTWAQARLSATQTSILMVTEPVWATLFAVVLWGERDPVRTYIGAVLILAATLAVLMRPRPPEVVVNETPTEPEWQNCL